MVGCKFDMQLSQCYARFELSLISFLLCIPVELHAEICYAESYALSIMLMFLEEQSFLALVKAGFRLRSINSIYKFCISAFKRKTNWESALLKENFEAGICVGWGLFNLVRTSLHFPNCFVAN